MEWMNLRNYQLLQTKLNLSNTLAQIGYTKINDTLRE